MKKAIIWIIVIAAIALGFCYWKGVGPFEKPAPAPVEAPAPAPAPAPAEAPAK